VLVGLQASGKSTFYARTFAGTHALVSKDLFRRARHRQRRQMRLIDEALTAGAAVVVDNTNPSPSEWAPLIEAARAHHARVTAYWFPPDLPGALARNAARQGTERVPDIGLYATMRQLRRPRQADGFDAVYEVRFDGHGGFQVTLTDDHPSPTAETETEAETEAEAEAEAEAGGLWGGDKGPGPRPLAVFDLDGTLADVRHRLHHLNRRPRYWNAFFAAAPDDPPLTEGLRLALAGATRCEIAYVTGRPENCRKDTADWLARHGLPHGRLLMRAEGDHRPARTAKPELLRRLAHDHPIAVAVDDDPQVCDAYESAGFRVLHATWMTRQALLEEVQEREGRT
jgi:predicted kinase